METVNSIRGRIQGGRDWGDRPPLKPTKVTFFHHDFVQFGKQHSRCKAILSSVGLSQQSFEVYLISPTVVNP